EHVLAVWRGWGLDQRRAALRAAARESRGVPAPVPGRNTRPPIGGKGPVVVGPPRRGWARAGGGPGRGAPAAPAPGRCAGGRGPAPRRPVGEMVRIVFGPPQMS